MMNLSFLQTVVIGVSRVLSVILAITFHEFAHGYVSYIMGDNTAKSDGRLSLNPFKHIDIVGALCLLLFGFGWAKPVQVNPKYYKQPKLGMAVTSLAGPMANFLLAFMGAALLKVLGNIGFGYLILTSLTVFISINIGLGVFNLIPIPPLDGFKILGAILSDEAYFSILQFESYGFIILVACLSFGILNPILTMGSNLVWSLFNIIL